MGDVADGQSGTQTRRGRTLSPPGGPGRGSILCQPPLRRRGQPPLRAPHKQCGPPRRLGDREGAQSYANRRFGDEANRLYGVLNNRLADRPYLAGNAYTIADIISYPWTANWKLQGHDMWGFKD